MRAVLGPHTVLGYCTNVHAGASLAEMRANLQWHAVRVKQAASPDAPMGVGLWFSAAAARELLERDGVAELRDWLGEQGLLPYTLNGFPYGNFHEPVVKHRVYQPDWTTQERYDHTCNLARILAGLLPEEAEGSISTLPIGWPSLVSGSPDHYEAKARQAAARLHDLVHFLARLELDTGRLIHVDLEPEPGCILETAPDVIRFFQDHLLGTQDDVSTRSYLRVCHDVCHSAVMFEGQAEAIQAYRSAGIRIGKVQLSSAVRCPLSSLPPQDRRAAMEQLQSFSEDRYLHQTVVAREGVAQRAFYEDLPQAIEEECDQLSNDRAAGDLRVHFHVPLFVERFGLLQTTQHEILECLRHLEVDDEVHHFEAETYAWSVLPAELRAEDLAAGIAQELMWLRQSEPGASATGPISG